MQNTVFGQLFPLIIEMLKNSIGMPTNAENCGTKW